MCDTTCVIIVCVVFAVVVLIVAGIALWLWLRKRDEQREEKAAEKEREARDAEKAKEPTSRSAKDPDHPHRGAGLVELQELPQGHDPNPVWDPTAGKAAYNPPPARMPPPQVGLVEGTYPPQQPTRFYQQGQYTHASTMPQGYAARANQMQYHGAPVQGYQPSAPPVGSPDGSPGRLRVQHFTADEPHAPAPLITNEYQTTGPPVSTAPQLHLQHYTADEHRPPSPIITNPIDVTLPPASNSYHRTAADRVNAPVYY